MNRTLFHTLLFAWFKKNGRILPWRKKIDEKRQYIDGDSNMLRDATIASYFTTTWCRDPYRIIISEMMLQQTQVDRVLPKFEMFLEKWPTVHDLASAKLSDVFIAWQGLGYNRRARFLHEMARAVVSQHKGTFPTLEEELLTLPGIGEYTARAILAFAYGKDVGVIDTNIKRIFSRTYFGTEADTIPVPSKEFKALIDETVPRGKGDPWNQTLMDFGAIVCTAKSPKCTQCPLQEMCMANQNAKKLGFKNYAAQLQQKLKHEKTTETRKPKEKFENTDRYFRGRIVDKLREGSIHMEDLRLHLEKNHGLTDRVRWGNIIERLVIDKLIQVKGSVVSLAE